MIQEGALENPHVDRIYGMHVWPTVTAGKVGVRWGPMMAQTCEFDMLVHGKSAHGASPQMGVDAIVCAAELITVLQTAITRNVDPHQDVLLTIGKIQGGVAHNVIADEVKLSGTLRVFSPAVYEQLRQRVGSMVQGLSMATGAKFEFKELMHYPCVNNPRPLVEDFYTYLDSMEDVELVEPVMAAEDFAYYQQSIPGLFVFLGIQGGKRMMGAGPWRPENIKRPKGENAWKAAFYYDFAKPVDKQKKRKGNNNPNPAKKNARPKINKGRTKGKTIHLGLGLPATHKP